MSERWGDCPPFGVNGVQFWRYEGDGTNMIDFKINQDTIKEIREYLDAVEEVLNG